MSPPPMFQLMSPPPDKPGGTAAVANISFTASSRFDTSSCWLNKCFRTTLPDHSIYSEANLPSKLCKCNDLIHFNDLQATGVGVQAEGAALIHAVMQGLERERMMSSTARANGSVDRNHNSAKTDHSSIDLAWQWNTTAVCGFIAAYFFYG
jgi:hypothetical protein